MVGPLFSGKTASMKTDVLTPLATARNGLEGFEEHHMRDDPSEQPSLKGFEICSSIRF